MIEKLINNLLEVLSLKKSINNEIPNIIEKIREAIASDTNLFCLLQNKSADLCSIFVQSPALFLVP